jgi:hypothetical protein
MQETHHYQRMKERGPAEPSVQKSHLWNKGVWWVLYRNKQRESEPVTVAWSLIWEDNWPFITFVLCVLCLNLHHAIQNWSFLLGQTKMATRSGWAAFLSQVQGHDTGFNSEVVSPRV